LEKIGNLELELSQNLSSEKRKELVSETQKLLKDF
jgi:hypothetical protein